MIKYHFIVPVWGDRYIKTFSDISLPTQLSPGNLGEISTSSDIKYCIYTRPEDKEKFKAYPSFQKLSTLIETEIYAAENINFNSDHHYSPFNECFKLGMKHAEKEKAACIFMCADQVWADGAFKTIIELGNNGKKAVLISGPRVEEEKFSPFFYSKLKKNDSEKVVLLPREAVKIAQKFMHPWDKSLFWDNKNMGRPASFMYWDMGDEGFLMRCFHLHPILLNPVKKYPDFIYTIDAGDFIKKGCPDINDLHIVEDSDQVMYFSIAPKAQSSEWIERPKTDYTGVLKWAKTMGLNSHNLFYLTAKIKFHTGDLSTKWNSTETMTDAFIEKLIIKLRNPLKLLYFKYLKRIHDISSDNLKKFPFLYNFLRNQILS